MRYQARWSNGYWKTFDTVAFTDIEIHGLQKDANDNAARLNARKR